MRPGVSRWFALISLLTLIALTSEGAGRPAYGGQLRVRTGRALTSLHPASREQGGSAAALKTHLLPSVFETLIKIDSRGAPEPALAVSWTTSSDFRRWTLSLRQGVHFHDGSLLDAQAVVDCLTTRENPFIVLDHDTRVVIDSADPQPDLLLDLAVPERAIFRTSTDGQPVGTGPFRIQEWESSRRGTLVAFEQHWKGRPFLDQVLINMGQDPRENWIELELGRADIVEVPTEEVRNAVERGHRVLTSRPLDLMVLAFTSSEPSPQETELRHALGLALDREAVHRVLLQKQGEPTASLLPGWITGFGFLFGPARDLNRARSLLVPLPRDPQLTLGYPARDRLAKSITDRLALDVQAAGIKLHPLPLTDPDRDAYLADVVLLRAPITTVDPKHALLDLASRLGLPAPKATNWDQPQDVFTAERELLKPFKVIPLFHLSFSYAVGKRVRYHRAEDIFLSDALHLEDVWLRQETRAQVPIGNNP